MNTQDAVAALGALAQETRLAVFRALIKRGPQGYTPGDLSARLEIPGPTLSFHLKELQRAGLVTCCREGRFLNYSASFAAMRALIGFLTEKCCTLSDVERDSSCAPVAAHTKQRARGVD
jgi:ArsR family transcriptional regulator, arsenate/arsenite/antimonite-responsive transcriptional repressor